MRVSNIIWDFDGTLYDTYGAIVSAFVSILSDEYGVEIGADRVLDLVKVDTKHCAKVVAQENDLDEKAVLTSARSAYDAQADIAQTPFDDVAEICRAIQSGGGRNFIVTHRDKASLDELLSKYDFHGYFVEIISADDGFALKPSPDSFNYLMAKYNLDATETVAIGDREMDVFAAQNAGLPSVYFSERSVTHPDATINIHQYSDLLTQLNSLNEDNLLNRDVV